jgi:hypothetical protein
MGLCAIAAAMSVPAQTAPAAPQSMPVPTTTASATSPPLPVQSDAEAVPVTQLTKRLNHVSKALNSAEALLVASASVDVSPSVLAKALTAETLQRLEPAATIAWRRMFGADRNPMCPVAQKIWPIFVAAQLQMKSLVTDVTFLTEHKCSKCLELYTVATQDGAPRLVAVRPVVADGLCGTHLRAAKAAAKATEGELCAMAAKGAQLRIAASCCLDQKQN